MAHNEYLTVKVRQALANIPEVEEKKMFRGISFMVNKKMCITTGDDELMCRIDPVLHEIAKNKTGCRPMIMKEREYKGYIYIKEDHIQADADFNYWINLALEFNSKLLKLKK